MRVLIKSSIFAILLMTSATASFSQSRYNIHIGPSFPLSNIDVYSFSFNDYDVSALAKTGIIVGFQYSYQIASSGIGIFAGFDIIYNDIIKEYKDSVEYYLNDWFGYESIEFPKYYNIPISTGIEYVYQATEQVSLTCNFGITYNFFKTSNQKIDDEYTETDWSSSLGFKAGFGIIIKEKASISLDYLGLGEHDTIIKLYDSGSFVTEGEIVKTVNMLTLTIGWNF